VTLDSGSPAQVEAAGRTATLSQARPVSLPTRRLKTAGCG
jgi:hypothetical protein